MPSRSTPCCWWSWWWDRLPAPAAGRPPGPAKPDPARPGAEAPADNTAAIAHLGGTVRYGRVDSATGQRSGITATITPAMVAAAARDELGSASDPSIRPPGLD